MELHEFSKDFLELRESFRPYRDFATLEKKVEDLGPDFRKRMHRLFEASRFYDEIKYVSYLSLVDVAVEYEKYPGLTERYLSLSHGHREAILYESSGMFNGVLELYLNLWETFKTKDYVFVYDQLGGLDTFAEFISKIKTDSKDGYEVNDYTSSSEFIETLRKIVDFTVSKIEYDRSKNFNSVVFMTVFLYLREIYSEPKILELLKRYYSERKVINLVEFASVLRNYSEMKEHPLDWIIAMTNLSTSTETA